MDRRSLIAALAGVIATPALAQVAPPSIPQSRSDCAPVVDPGARFRCEGSIAAPPVAPAFRPTTPSVVGAPVVGVPRRVRRRRRRR